MFQSLCRGEASATRVRCIHYDVITSVSIPLSRGSLCNKTKFGQKTQPTQGFNPSVEGKPLQPKVSGMLMAQLSMCFNPSVEGKPLQHIRMIGCVLSILFQSLCRGEASATRLVRLLQKSARPVSIPLSRGSLCNVETANSYYVVKVEFQSLCRGEASATYC